MTLLNFASKNLQTVIHTSSLSVDHYEAENLIQDENNSIFPRKPFMAEYYVKCPVCIVLQFPFLVDIAAIRLGRKVTNHVSKCLEIYTASQPPIIKNKAVPCSYKVDLKEQTSHNFFNFVGKFNEKFNSPVDNIVFKNHMHTIEPPSSVTNNAFILTLKPLHSTRACSHLLVKITYASIAVLSHLEVWATISSRNPLFYKKICLNFITSKLNYCASANKEKEGVNETSDGERINKLHDNRSPRTEKQGKLLVSPNMNKGKSQNEKQNDDKGDLFPSNLSNEGDGIKIPEEFIDPITYEMMNIPLLLPSGKNIDQSTYNKFVHEEAKYGKVPCDPFTGVIFHKTSKPVPNMPLKFRIDQFVMKYKVGTKTADILGDNTTRTLINRVQNTIVNSANPIVDSASMSSNLLSTSKRKEYEPAETILAKKARRRKKQNCHLETAPGTNDETLKITFPKKVRRRKQPGQIIENTTNDQTLETNTTQTTTTAQTNEGHNLNVETNGTSSMTNCESVEFARKKTDTFDTIHASRILNLGSERFTVYGIANEQGATKERLRKFPPKPRKAIDVRTTRPKCLLTNDHDPSEYPIATLTKTNKATIQTTSDTSVATTRLVTETRTGREPPKKRAQTKEEVGVQSSQAEQDHQDELYRSLETEIAKTMLSLPILTLGVPSSSSRESSSSSRESPQVSTRPHATTNQKQCQKCKSTELGKMYHLKCLHCYCRECLVQVLLRTKKCGVCETEVTNHDVTKVR